MARSAARVDVHHHAVPAFYGQMLEESGHRPGGVAVPAWTSQKSLRLMDRSAIATSILSVSTPGAWFGDGPKARGLARDLNEHLAGVVADNPRRFGFFATLTLPDVEGALAEAEYALDVLNADGIVLLTSAAEQYVYEPQFEPLLAYLHARKAVVFVHPGELPAAPAPGIPAFTADFLLETVRAATGLVLSGCLERYGDIRWILSHAGGFLPYISHRILLTMLRDEPKLVQAKAVIDRKREARRRLDVLRRFYFDIALSSTPSALPSLLAFADPTRVLYGSDYPFAPSPAVTFMRREYEDMALERDVRRAIDRGNAIPLFPRLVA